MDSATFIKNKNTRRNIKAYWALIILITGLMAYYSYFEVKDLLHKSDLIASQQVILSDLEDELASEQQNLENLATLKNDLNKKINNDLELIFPQTENYTNLTRELDAFFLDLGTSKNPIFVSNLQYGTPRLNADGNFGVLPITLTMNSSRENFDSFLEYIETSGNLTNKIRLMDVQSIKVNFQKGAANLEKGEVNLSLSMNAYFQKPTS